jgi:hypothetical protein
MTNSDDRNMNTDKAASTQAMSDELLRDLYAKTHEGRTITANAIDFARALLAAQPASGAQGEVPCPYPCGWKEVNSLFTQRAANVLRGIDPEYCDENAWQYLTQIIDTGKTVIRACLAASAQPIEPTGTLNYDEWAKQPYTLTLMKSIENDYVPKADQPTGDVRNAAQRFIDACEEVSHGNEGEPIDEYISALRNLKSVLQSAPVPQPTEHPPCEGVQAFDLSKLRRFACFEIEDGIYEHASGSYVLFRDVRDLLAAPVAQPVEKPVAKTDYCVEKLKAGGCQLHNLHCGYPKCNEAPTDAAPLLKVEPTADAEVKRD